MHSTAVPHVHSINIYLINIEGRATQELPKLPKLVLRECITVHLDYVDVIDVAHHVNPIRELHR